MVLGETTVHGQTRGLVTGLNIRVTRGQIAGLIPEIRGVILDLTIGMTRGQTIGAMSGQIIGVMQGRSIGVNLGRSIGVIPGGSHVGVMTGGRIEVRLLVGDGVMHRTICIAGDQRG